MAEPSDAGLRADRRQSRLDPRVAEVALLGLARVPVEVDLLVGAAGDAEAPGAARLLIDEHDPVLLALVHRARGAGGDAGGVDAVLADPRQVHHERLLELELDLVLEAAAVRVGARRELRGRRGRRPSSGPIRRSRSSPLTSDFGRAMGWTFARRCADQVLVVVGPGLVVVVERRQVRVPEDARQLLQPPPGPELQPALAVELPAAVPALLVLVVAGVAASGLRLDVVEPDVLGAGTVGPDVLAGDRAGVTPDALVEVHHHPDLRPDLHP